MQELNRNRNDRAETRPGRTLWRVIALCALLAGTVNGGMAYAENDAPVLIGALTSSWGITPHIAGLRDGLVALGYRENEDFVIGVRFVQGKIALLADAAQALVRESVDIIFCVGNPEVKAAQAATTTIPIVFTGVGDPIGAGLIESYAHPGGNTTGVADLNLMLSAKRLQIFKELMPGLKRVLVPYSASNAYAVAKAKAYRKAAQMLDIVLIERPIRSLQEARATLEGYRKDETDGILSPRDATYNIPGFVLEASARLGIPSMFGSAFFLKDGGFASYGPSFYGSGRLAARQVDKIIKGANPGEIPVEVDEKLEFVVNLKVAKEMGIEIPREVLYQADRIIR